VAQAAASATIDPVLPRPSHEPPPARDSRPLPGPRIDPVGVDPTHTEPRHTEPRRTEPAHTEPAHTEPAHTEPAHTEPAHSEPKHIEPKHIGPMHAELQRAQMPHAEPVRTKPVRPRNASRPGPPVLDRDPDRQHSKRWFATLSVLGVIVLLAVCALGTYFMVKDERPPTVASKQASAPPAPKPRDISNRTVDPAPLTEQELFPQPTLVVAGSGQPYQVLKTQQSADCKVSATDDLGTQLVSLGCSQVVRATLRSPDGQFLVTAGIFNFPDEASANRAYQVIKPTVDAQKGHLLGLLAGPGTDAILRAPTHLGWFVRGHFMAFCVIARVDGRPIPEDDPYARQIATDLVETHLRDTVIGARAVERTGSPAGAPPS
jgi:hypothetical protein